jgi:cyclophilin family peptidyl-prolyl cis-trans isomerase
VRREKYIGVLPVCVLVTCLVAGRVGIEAKEDKKEGERDGVRATLELNRDYYYAGDSLPVRISLANDGAASAQNPVKSPLLRGFVVRSGGSVLRPTGTSSAQEPARPDKIAPQAFFGTVVDLVELYPELRQPGEFEIRWEADGLESNALTVRLIPRLAPGKDYRARVETSEGSFTIDIFQKNAPLAFKAFTDLANLGYYDGLLVHEVRPDTLIAAGDPVQSNVSRAPFLFPQEQSPLPVVAGTVLMRPVGAAPPANGSAFIVMLRPEPSMNGQATVVGQVTDGLEVLGKISRLPSTEQGSRPFFRPLKDVKIQKITITAKGDPAAPSTP